MSRVRITILGAVMAAILVFLMGANGCLFTGTPTDFTGMPMGFVGSQTTAVTPMTTTSTGTFGTMMGGFLGGLY